jgi:hypothetical protein
MKPDPAADFLHVALSASTRHAPSATKRLRALAYLKACLDAARDSRGTGSAGPTPAASESTPPHRSDATSRFN